jgi:hypothetical protein
MGLGVDKLDTRHNIEFEIRSESVVFYDPDIYPDEWVEIDMNFLRRLAGLLNDPEWSSRLTAPAPQNREE